MTLIQELDQTIRKMYTHAPKMNLMKAFKA